MSDATNRLRSLQVADVMNRNPVQVSANQTMTEAAEMLTQHGVTSAPVMDEQGRCVGIVSAADFLRRESRNDEHSMTLDTHDLVSPPGDQPLHISPVAENMVSSYMSRAVQSVGPNVSLLKAAQMMMAEHIHRLPVLDNDGRAIGMVSTMDVVSSLINAVDEEATSFVRQMHSGDF